MLDAIYVRLDTVLTRLDDMEKYITHADAGIHENAQRLGLMAGHIDGIVAELDAAKPLIEKAQRSMIRKLAAGQMPWT